MFAPSVSDPASSTLIYQYGEIGTVSGDVSDDIVFALQGNGFFPASTPETDNIDWKVYPNPTSEFIIIQTTGNDFAKAIGSLQTVTGQVLQTNLSINQPIDVSELANGVYFLSVTRSEQTSVVKFVKH